MQLRSGYVVVLHTMTVTLADCDCRIGMQFFHAVPNGGKWDDGQLIGRRMRVKSYSNGRTMKRSKVQRCWTNEKELRAMLKRKNARIEHRLKTLSIGSLIHHHLQRNQSPPVDRELPERSPPSPPNQRSSPILTNPDQKINGLVETNEIDGDQLVSHSSPDETASWLVQNRFAKHCDTFASFSGADMLRMSRDDLIQICGQVDGIRLYNSIHLKTIAPKLKIYVCREHTSVFNAVFLLSYNNAELLEKLCPLMGIEQDQVRDIYVEGPHSIHVQLTNDLMRHIGEETMFSVEILPDNSTGRYALLLKRTIK